jgi:hypothetical protein
MLNTRTLIALSIVAALFFLTGAQVFTYAMPNSTSMAGNMTNATMANATSNDVNRTGNVSGLTP